MKNCKKSGEILQEDIFSKMHRKGINYRHLGEVRHSVPDDEENEELRLHLLELAVFRTTKNMIRDEFRRTNDELKIPADEPFLLIVAKYFNHFSMFSKKKKMNLLKK